MKDRLRLLAAAALIVIAGAGVSSAQQAFASTSAPPLFVRLSVTAAPGVPATVTLRNGQLGRWTRADGTQYGLTPVVANGTAQIAILELTPGTAPGSERVKALATITLKLGKAVSYPEANPLFEVTLLGTSPIPAASTMGSDSNGPCTTCCVTCGEWTVCACAVQMECGSCCCKNYCLCFGEEAGAQACSATPAGSAAREKTAATRR
jgi:hypothetical protein